MTELWTPSDDLLFGDGIAKAKIDNPFEPADLEAAGVLLPEAAGDAAVQAAAAVALAEIDESEPDCEPTAVADDDAVEDVDELVVGVDV